MNAAVLLVKAKQSFQSGAYDVLRASGSVFQADVLRVDVGRQAVIIKDYSRRGRWARWVVCRFLLRREMAVLQAVADTGWVPDYYGLIGKYAFAMQYVKGVTPCKYGGFSGEQVYSATATLLASMHQRGYAHNDLRRSNIIISDVGSVCFIDFASVLSKTNRCRWLMFAWNWLIGVLQRADSASLLKMKPSFTGKALTELEKKRMRKPAVVRALQFLWTRLINKPLLRRIK